MIISPVILNILLALAISGYVWFERTRLDTYYIAIFYLFSLFFAFAYFQLYTDEPNFWFQTAAPEALSRLALLYLATLFVARYFCCHVQWSEIEYGRYLIIFCWVAVGLVATFDFLMSDRSAQIIFLSSFFISSVILSVKQNDDFSIKRVSNAVFLLLLFCVFAALLEFVLDVTYVRNTFHVGIAELRPSSFFLNPNWFGLFLAICLIFAFALYFFELYFIAGVMIALSSAGLVLSASRSSIFLVGIFILVTYFLFLASIDKLRIML